MTKSKNYTLAAIALAALIGAGSVGLITNHLVSADENTDTTVQNSALEDRHFTDGRPNGLPDRQMPHFDLDDLVSEGIIDQDTADRIQAYLDEKQAAFEAEHPEIASMKAPRDPNDNLHGRGPRGKQPDDLDLGGQPPEPPADEN